MMEYSVSFLKISVNLLAGFLSKTHFSLNFLRIHLNQLKIILNLMEIGENLRQSFIGGNRIEVEFDSNQLYDSISFISYHDVSKKTKNVV